MPAFLYAQPSGREPVREWLKELSAEDRKIVGEDIKDVELAWPIGMPLCRSLGKGLWEVRSNLAGSPGCCSANMRALLHAFIKNTQKTPAGDLEVAIQRKREVT